LKILGLDPGTRATGWVIYDAEEKRVLATAPEKGGRTQNELLLRYIVDPSAAAAAELAGELPGGREFFTIGRSGIEKITLYQRVNDDVHDTILWYGKFQYALEENEVPTNLYPRSTIRATICPDLKSPNDSAVIAALKDKVGPPGTKKLPGPTYGITGHSWQALAAAIHDNLANTLAGCSRSLLT
jgi:hypothetical protein